MSTTSLSLPPSSDPLDTLRMQSSDPPAAPAPAPKVRRTYGRARPASPSPPPPTDAPTSSMPRESPSKALLNRWSNASTSWRDSLALLDTPSSDPAVDDEDAMKKAMEKLRREARGEPSKELARPEPLDNLEIPKGRLGVSFSSSSLTSLPTSPPPSSPPKGSSPKAIIRKPTRLQAESSEVMEETLFPVRSGVQSGKSRRIIVSDEENEEEDEDSQPESPRRARIAPAASPTPTPKARRKAAKPTLDSTDRSRSATPTSEDEDRDPHQDLDAFVRDLNAKEDEEEAREAEQAQINEQAALNGLFEDDGKDSTPQPKKGRSKGLNKQELAEMQKDIARAKREQPVHFSKPEVERLPISTWVQMAGMAIKQKEPPRDVPGLTFGHGSPATSPSHVTPPDEITSFTPSSALRPLNVATSKVSMVDAASSSPTPIPALNKGKGRAVVPASSEGADEEEDDDEQDFSLFMAKEKQKDEAAERVEEKARRLAEFKLAQLKQLREQARPTKPVSADLNDDFDVLDISPVKPKAKPVTIAPPAIRRGPDAKAVLTKTGNVTAISKQRQQMLQRAGKAARPKSEQVSETYIDFAARAFSHSELRRSNGGSKPAGQKMGRDAVISHLDVDKAMKMKHQQQVQAYQRKKEEDWGRARKLPERVEPDVEALVDMTNQAAPAESEEEEEEDGEFVPDDEGEEAMAYSGEESGADGEGSDVELEDASDVETEAGNQDAAVTPAVSAELSEDDEEEPVPIIRRKPRASARIAESDDEDVPTKTSTFSVPAPTAATAKSAAQPAAEVVGAPESLGNGFGEDIDLGGFGDSQGFSQLFDATQVETGQQDAFAQLRAQEPVGLLPVNAMLPQVQISETQAERDNALIAGELEDAADAAARVAELDEPKKLYLNEHGLFTQTNPALLATQATQNASQHGLRTQLGGNSLDFSSNIFEETQSQTQQSPPLSPLRDLDPTHASQSFTRLRRRVSASEDEQPTLSPTQPVRSSEDFTYQSNAFDRMMTAAHRPQLQGREQQKSKGRSRLVDEQAEESDEDNGWAPVGGPDDEDDDEDGDGYVEGLVDDEAVDEEEKKKQDALAAEKAREIAAADDARREAEAKKITEGQYRTKRKGMDFYSDEEGDDELRSKRLSKKQRRKRMLGREDGLDKLDGEANVFKLAYEEDLESDLDDIEDTPLSPMFDSGKMALSPEPEDEDEVEIAKPKRSMKETYALLKERARMNRGLDLDADEETQRLDKEIGFDEPAAYSGSGAKRPFKRNDTLVDFDEDDQRGEQFSIARRSNSMIIDQDQKQNQNQNHEVTQPPSRRLSTMSSTRSLASYAQYVADEATTTRRVGGAGAVSVVYPKASSSSGAAGRSFSSANGGNGGFGAHGRPPVVPHPHRQSTSSSSSGSILMSKGNKFA